MLTFDSSSLHQPHYVQQHHNRLQPDYLRTTFSLASPKDNPYVQPTQRALFWSFPGSGGKVKNWFDKSPTYSLLSTTAQRLRDITDPNPPIVEAMDEDHVPSATSKSNPAPPKFPNRIKAAISHNEYCILGQVFLALTNAPQVV